MLDVVTAQAELDPEIAGLTVAFTHSGATLALVAGELLAHEIVIGAPHPMLVSFNPAGSVDGPAPDLRCRQLRRVDPCPDPRRFGAKRSADPFRT